MGQRLLDSDSDFFANARAWAMLQTEINRPGNDLPDGAPGARGDVTRGEWVIMQSTEQAILNHDPESLAEVIVQLEVIANDMNDGNRIDGLDVVAIRKVQRYLADQIRHPFTQSFVDYRSDAVGRFDLAHFGAV